jgi:hypothetical protein
MSRMVRAQPQTVHGFSAPRLRVREKRGDGPSFLGVPSFFPEEYGVIKRGAAPAAPGPFCGGFPAFRLCRARGAGSPQPAVPLL